MASVSSTQITQQHILKKVAINIAKMNSLVLLKDKSEYRDIFAFNKKA